MELGYRGFRGSGGEGGRIVKVVFQTSHLRHKKQSFFAVLELSFVLRGYRGGPAMILRGGFGLPMQLAQIRLQILKALGRGNKKFHTSVSRVVAVAELWADL